MSAMLAWSGAFDPVTAVAYEAALNVRPNVLPTKVRTLMTTHINGFYAANTHVLAGTAKECTFRSKVSSSSSSSSSSSDRHNGGARGQPSTEEDYSTDALSYDGELDDGDDEADGDNTAAAAAASAARSNRSNRSNNVQPQQPPQQAQQPIRANSNPLPLSSLIVIADDFRLEDFPM